MNKYSVKLLNNELNTKKKSTYGGGCKLTNDELTKWTRILGPKKIIALHIDSKIRLSSKQLERVIDIKNKEIESNDKNKPVTRDEFDRAFDVVMTAVQTNEQKDEREN